MSFVHVARSPRGGHPARRPAAARPLFRVEQLESRDTPSTTLVDVNASVLGAASGQAEVLGVTPSGRYAIFSSTANDVIPSEITTPGTTNLYWVDFLTGQRKLVTAAPAASGTTTDPITGKLVYDFTNATTTFTQAFPGVEAFGQAVISDDGQYVGFTSKVNAGSIDIDYATTTQFSGATRTTSADRGDATYDAFRWQAKTGQIRLASRTYDNGTGGASVAFGNSADVSNIAISGDGSKMTFVSSLNAADVYPAPAAGAVGTVKDNGDSSPDLFETDFIQIQNGVPQTTACIDLVSNPYGAEGKYPSFFWKEPFGTIGYVSGLVPESVNVFGKFFFTVDTNGNKTITDITGSPASVGYSPTGVRVDALGRYMSADGTTVAFLSDVSPVWTFGAADQQDVKTTIPLTNQGLDVYLANVVNVTAAGSVALRTATIANGGQTGAGTANGPTTIAVTGGSADNAIMARQNDNRVLFTARVGDATKGTLIPGYAGATGSGSANLNLYLREIAAGDIQGQQPILVNAPDNQPLTAATGDLPTDPTQTNSTNPSVDPRSYAITPDGLYAAFTTKAPNMIPVAAGVPANRGSNQQVYRRLLNQAVDASGKPVTGLLKYASVNTAGTAVGNGNSYNPAISPDGRYVAFESLATNLVASGIDTNNAPDIYLRDYLASTNAKGVAVPATQLVSASPDGTAAGNSTGPATFTDGVPNVGSYRPFIGTGRVLFTSTASNLETTLTVTEGTPHGYVTDLPLTTGGGGGGSTDVGAVSGGTTAAASLIGFTGNGNINITSTFTPFPGFTGELRVATADVNGDGVPDLIVGSGPGGGPRVVVIDGKTGSTLYNFFAFESSFTGGLYVAGGDFNKDGFADIVIGADQGGGSRVRVISGKDGKTVLGDFYAYESSFTGGVRVAVGDVTGDGTPDIITGAGFGGGPRVSVFDGASMFTNAARTATRTPNRVVDMFAFEAGVRNGVFVGAGDINGDGVADVVVGGGPGGGPRVSAFDGKSLISNASSPTVLVNFFAFPDTSRNGVHVAVHDIDGSGTGSLLVGQGAGDQSRVRTYQIPSGTSSSSQQPVLVDDQILYGDFGSLNGAWVG